MVSQSLEETTFENGLTNHPKRALAVCAFVNNISINKPAYEIPPLFASGITVQSLSDRAIA